MQEYTTLFYSPDQIRLNKLWIISALPVGMGLIAACLLRFAPGNAVPIVIGYSIGCVLHAFNAARILFFEQPLGARFEVSYEGVKRFHSSGKQQSGCWCDLESIEGVFWIHWGLAGYLCWAIVAMFGLSWPFTLRFRGGDHVRIPMKGAPGLAMTTFFWPMVAQASVHGLPVPFARLVEFGRRSVWGSPPSRRIAFYGVGGGIGVVGLGWAAVAGGQELDGSTLLLYGTYMAMICTGTIAVTLAVRSSRKKR